MVTFDRPVKLPVFFDDLQSECLIDGYEELGYGHDGIANRVRIQPFVKNGFVLERQGQDYTIGVNHLNRLIHVNYNDVVDAGDAADQIDEYLSGE